MIDYGRLARYYDLVQRQLMDYPAEARAMHDILGNYQVRTVLDLACGTGAHLLELVKFGYQCVGADLASQMIEVAREKARTQKLPIEFLLSNILNYQLDRRFDAVLAVYALATLVDDADFRAALASARRAVRDGGLFYLNVFNADSEGAEQLCGAGPIFYLDVVVNEPEIRLVRFNQSICWGNVQDWTATYLIDEGQGVKMIVGTDQLRFHHLAWVQDELSRAGFQFQSVTYSDVQGLKDFDMFILAQANVQH